MTSSSFLEKIIQEQIGLFKNKNYSKFDNLLTSILLEQDVVPGTISSPPNMENGIAPSNPPNNTSSAPVTSELPPEHPEVMSKLAEIAVASLVTNVPSLASDKESYRKIYNDIAELKQRGIRSKEEGLKAIELILPLIKPRLSANFALDDHFKEVIKSSDYIQYLQIIINSLLFNQDDKEGNSPEISQINDVSGLLKDMETYNKAGDVVQSSKISEDIFKKITPIITSASASLTT